MEGIKADVLDEVDPIDLDLVDLGPELNGLVFFASDNRPEIVLGQRDDPVFRLDALVKELLLLLKNGVNRLYPMIISQAYGLRVAPLKRLNDAQEFGQ